MTFRPERPRVRRVIGVLSCDAHRDRRQACEETWVPQIERPDTIVVFLLGVPNLAVESKHSGRTLELRCGDAYADLPEKTRRFAAWALQTYRFDHLFKCDDDTYINAASFHAFDVRSADYLGAPMTPSYASGGCGYFLSARAAAVVAPGPLEHWAEDRAVGERLLANNIDLVPDNRFRNCNEGWDGTPFPDAITHHLQRLPAARMRLFHDAMNQT